MQPVLNNNQIRELHVLVDQYILLKERGDEVGLSAWRNRVRETFPYETNVMLAKIREIAEEKERKEKRIA